MDPSALSELPNADRLYRAWVARDARYDGRAFLAVKTTGIYCRPVCPAPTPKRRNVCFFACAAAAEAAGFRPCRRCRPETSPGTPGWLGSSATVSRALRLIGDGVLDDDGVEPLADRLGVGSRHLRRLFLRHLGATPIAVARSRRLHFAKRLVEETGLPMWQIADHSGFQSIRQFNQAFHDVFRLSPRDLRRRVNGGTKAAALTLTISFRPPFDFSGLLDFLAMRAIPGVEEVSGDAYRRTIAVDGEEPAIVQVRPRAGKNVLELSITPPLESGLLGVVERVRRLFDIGADPATIERDLARDPRLGGLLKRRRGIRVPGAFDGFELAVRAILGQQVSVAGATTLAGRLVRAFGREMKEARGSLTHLFPEPAVLAEADVASIGMPGSRGRAINALAAAVAKGELRLEPGSAPDEVKAKLVAIPGIGPWTAEYVAMRALGEPDAMPHGDLGLRRALGSVTTAELEAMAEAWRPWRAYATILLWRSE